MFNEEKYTYDLLQRLSFTRFGGTEDELKAAELLKSEIEGFGGKAEIEDFQIPSWKIEKAAISVVEPYQEEIECVGWGRSGQLPEGGKDLELRYIEVNSPAGFYGNEDLTGCVAMIEMPIDWDFYKALYDRHAEAIILISRDKWYQTGETTDLIGRHYKASITEIGRIPSFMIRSGAAVKLINSKAKKLHLELRQQEFMNTSRNVLAVIEGTEPVKGEEIAITAHFDSISRGTGSWDNGSGSCAIMFMYQHFLKNPPKRTLRFIWCGSEEQGLLGSRAYVEMHPDIVKNICFNLNFDMNGTAIGTNRIHLTGDNDLKLLCEKICDEAGYAIGPIRVGVASSDSAPFSLNNIQSVGLGRGTMSGEIHTSYDLMPLMSEEKLYMNAKFFCFFAERFVNAKIFPVKRDLPDNLKKDARKYFQLDQLEALAKERAEK